MEGETASFTDPIEERDFAKLLKMLEDKRVARKVAEILALKADLDPDQKKILSIVSKADLKKED